MKLLGGKNRIVFFTALLAGFAKADGETEDPATWPACSAEAPKTCTDGFYLNPVACQCFAKI